MRKGLFIAIVFGVANGRQGGEKPGLPPGHDVGNNQEKRFTDWETMINRTQNRLKSQGDEMV